MLKKSASSFSHRQRVNVLKRRLPFTRWALLDGLFEHPAEIFSVEPTRADHRRSGVDIVFPQPVSDTVRGSRRPSVR